MKFTQLILLIFAFQSCQGQSEPIKLNGVTVSGEMMASLKRITRQTPANFEQVNFRIEKEKDVYTESYDTIQNGFYFKALPGAKARMLVKKYYEQSLNTGNFIFMTNLEFDDDWNSIYDLVILKAKDQFEVVNMMNTDGINYDLTNSMIVKKLKEWHEDVGLEIIVIDRDRIEANIKEFPPNLNAFLEEIYEFCPDVIDQGYGEMSEMLNDYKTNQYFWLWWD